MVQRLSKQHYLATPGQLDPYLNSRRYMQHHSLNKGYSTDGEDSQRSEHTVSEYITSNERMNTMGGGKRETRSPERVHGKHSRSRSRSGSREYIPSRASSRGKEYSHQSLGNGINGINGMRGHDDQDSSDIYVTSGAYRAPSEYSRGSRYSPQSRAPSRYSYVSGPPGSQISVKTKVKRKPGMTIETMSAPNPFCPNTKGICCLMLLLNLALILIALGFVIVVQFFEPLFVWILGIIFLGFGFLTLMGSLIYCVYVFRDARTPKQVAAQDHYWTHHWQKSFGATPNSTTPVPHPSTPSEIRYKTEKYLEDPYMSSHRGSSRH
ncbi:uncharacterized protein [Bemisia tabaci]|uniref:uncharacterized protein isoform X2 n=1 Tax=Bemisia tabaci TaxID=7038 RepID=UPI003B27F5ED